jgi:hypothetical protein
MKASRTLKRIAWVDWHGDDLGVPTWIMMTFNPALALARAIALRRKMGVGLSSYNSRRMEAITQMRLAASPGLGHEGVGDEYIGAERNNRCTHSGFAILYHGRDHCLFVEQSFPEKWQIGEDLRTKFAVRLQ